jgi:DNA-binding transcriptional MocR family regulator
MGVVEELVVGDLRIKGMWCVPKYSSPTSARCSSATIERLARICVSPDRGVSPLVLLERVCYS